MHLPPPLSGIGSLPHDDAAGAYRFIREFTPDIPYVAQFPKSGRFGEMLFEIFEAAPELIETSGRGAVKKGALEDALEWCSGPGDCRAVVRTFSSEMPASDWPRVKAQLVGPFTMLTQLQHAGLSLLGQEAGRAFVRRALSRQIQNEVLRLKAGRAELFYVLDEPVLGFLRKKEALQARATAIEVFAQIRKSGARPGVHCCSPLPGGAVSSVLNDLGLEVLSLDFSSLKPVAETIDPRFLRAHFERGGRVFWGLVPSVGGCVPENIRDWWKRAVRELEIPYDVILSQSVLTPACGLGLVSVDKAESIVRSLREVQNEIMR